MDTLSPRRILALWLRRLPTDRIERKRKASGEAPERIAPLVVVAKEENALRLSAVDARAARLGLAPGMPLANARAMIPKLDVVEADAWADAALLASIADWCDRFTPFVALDEPHGLFLDITGAAHLFGGERAMLETVRDAIARQGFGVQAALAGTSLAARALARYAPNTIVAPGKEADAVANLPVAALSADPKATHSLRRAGLKTVGQVAARGRAELTARFGAEFVAGLDRVLGKSEAPISPRRHLPDYMAEHRFAEPVVTEEVIAATLHALAAALAQVLEERGEGARMLEAAFFRADGQMRRLAVRTGGPTRDPRVIEKLFREKLDALSDPLDPGFGFDLIRLEAVQAEADAHKAASFDTDENAEREIAFLVDRLAARFGSDRILRFHPQDTHIPEAETVAVPAQQVLPPKPRWRAPRAMDEAPRRPLRMFAKPEPIETMAEVPDGPPRQFRWRRVLHRIARAEGPERIAMEWLRTQESQPTRDYFRVEDDEGRRFWLYRDGLYHRETETPRWYVHGLFA
jgi:protein ImuB